MRGLSNLCATPLADGPMPYKYKKSDNGANWDISGVDTPLHRYAEALLLARTPGYGHTPCAPGVQP